MCGPATDKGAKDRHKSDCFVWWSCHIKPRLQYKNWCVRCEYTGYKAEKI